MVAPNIGRSMGHLGQYFKVTVGHSVGILAAYSTALLADYDTVNNGNRSTIGGAIAFLLGAVMFTAAGSTSNWNSEWMVPAALGSFGAGFVLVSGFGLDKVNTTAESLGVKPSSSTASSSRSQNRRRARAIPRGERKRAENDVWATPRSRGKEVNRWGSTRASARPPSEQVERKKRENNMWG